MARHTDLTVHVLDGNEIHTWADLVTYCNIKSRQFREAAKEALMCHENMGARYANGRADTYEELASMVEALANKNRKYVKAVKALTKHDCTFD